MSIDIDFIREQLRRRRDERQLNKVADGAGVSIRTLTYILDGRGARQDTAEKLQAYLKTNMRKKKLEGASNG